MDEKQVKFGAVDNGIGSFMKRLKEDTQQLYGEFAREAKKQSREQKEQLNIVEDQIKALERQTKLEKELNLILLERKRADGTISKKDYGLQSRQIRADSRVDSAQGQMLRDTLDRLKDNLKDSNTPANQKQMFAAMLGAGVFRDMWSMVRQTASASTELDLISPFGQMVGGAAGGLIGATFKQGAAGATVGKELGGFTADAWVRSLKERDRFQSAGMRVAGMMGGFSAQDLSNLGLDLAGGAQLQEQIARATGGKFTLADIRGTQVAHRAFGIDTGDMAGHLSSRRMGDTAANPMNVVRLFQEGIDRSILGDFIKTQTALTAQMAQTSLVGDSFNAEVMLTYLNNIGGAFSDRDPRSAQFASGIQSQLANPTSSFAQAISYSLLRKEMPNASPLDLLIERQRGGANRLRSTLELLGQSGDNDLGTFLTASMFGLGSNLGAAQHLFTNRGSRLRPSGVGSGGTDTARMDEFAMGEAERLTPTLARNQARVTNSFINSFSEGIETLALLFTNRMGEAIEAMVAEKLTGKKSPIVTTAPRQSEFSCILFFEA